jgi:hypothetical protein
MAECLEKLPFISIFLHIFFYYFTFFLLSLLEKKSRVQQSKMSCEVIGSRSNANVSLISRPFCVFLFFLFLFFSFPSFSFQFSFLFEEITRFVSSWSAGRDWN